MITSSTSFIIGAGASRPYGYPTGFELRNWICEYFVSEYAKLLGHSGATEKESNRKIETAKDFIIKFRGSGNPSIDLWLSRNLEYADIGKIAIAAFVLIHEKQEPLQTAIKEGDQDWFSFLFTKMTQKLKNKSDFVHFNKNNVAFITFNYDRSLEYLLYRSLINTFTGISADKIIEIIKQIRICHVYGEVDKFPWGGGDRDYAEIYTLDDVNKASQTIKIVGERVDHNKITDVTSWLSNSQRIFFLGFSYAQENLDAIGIPTIISEGVQFNGTALHLVSEEIANIRGHLNKSGKKPINRIEDCDCKMLLRRYL